MGDKRANKKISAKSDGMHPSEVGRVHIVNKRLH